MFTKYWRNYPWFLQLFLFAMMVLIFLGLTGLVMNVLIPRLTGVAPQAIRDISATTGESVIRSLVYANAMGGILVFAMPCLVFAYLTTPRPGEYLGFRLPGKSVHWLLVLGLMLGFLMVSSFAEEWITRHITLPASLKKEQADNDNTIAAMLRLKSMRDQIIAFVGMAIVPAFGEELMFRGVMLRFARKRSKNMIFPIIISATFFTLAHANYIGFPFILTAGILLAVIYWFTKSILCSMLGHFAFNGIQVALAFWGPKNLSVPSYMFFVGLGVAIISFYALWKTKTPLPDNWAEDFSDEEKIEQQATINNIPQA